MRILKPRLINFLRDINSSSRPGLINFKDTRPMTMD